MTPAASFIISFYNKIEWLELVLAALERQTFKNIEVIIADDGSRPEVVARIHELQKVSPLTLKHLWHADNGFMKTVMLNKAIQAANSEYLIFIDGDCVPHKHFVEDHIRLRKHKQVLVGRRVNLSDRVSKSLSTQGIHKGQLERFFLLRVFVDSVFGGSRDAEKGIHLRSKLINQRLGSFNKGLLGCNFSLYKQELLAINGFDERYRHPSVGEDTEIEYRLRLNGCAIFRPKFCLVQYHLWHKRLSREQESNNLKLYAETKEKGYAATPYGMNTNR
jgi:glycosyltransferase involved in cell wall biosynthesis